MKLSSSFLSSSLALAAVTLSAVSFTSSARATVSATYNGLSSSSSGDIILGFRTAATTGNNVVINLGAVADLKAATGTVYLGNLSAILTSAYGASWSSTNVYWTVGGQIVFESGARTVYAGQSQTSTGAHRPGYVTPAGGATTSGIGTALTYYPDNTGTRDLYYFSDDIQYTDTGLTAVSYDASATISGLAAGGWGKGLSATLGYGFLNRVGPNSPYQATKFGESNLKTGESLDFYEILSRADATAGAAAALLGYFTIESDGDFYYTSSTSAVPEPATYAALFGAASLVIAALVRRRRSVR